MTFCHRYFIPPFDLEGSIPTKLCQVHDFSISTMAWHYVSSLHFASMCSTGDSAPRTEQQGNVWDMLMCCCHVNQWNEKSDWTPAGVTHQVASWNSTYCRYTKKQPYLKPEIPFPHHHCGYPFVKELQVCRLPHPYPISHARPPRWQVWKGGGNETKTWWFFSPSLVVIFLNTISTIIITCIQQKLVLIYIDYCTPWKFTACLPVPVWPLYFCCYSTAKVLQLA